MNAATPRFVGSLDGQGALVRVARVRTSGLRLASGLFAGLVVAVASAAGESGFAGLWRTEQPKRGGVVVRHYFEIADQGDGFTVGVYFNDASRITMRHPHLDGSEAVFDDGWGTEFRLARAGEQLRVRTINHGQLVSDLPATRVPASAIAPPPALPLPEFVPLPANGLALTPPMGWNSWNHFAENVDDAVVREVADALVSSGLAAAGYQYVVIDDTWAGRRDDDGRLQANAKFPDMKALADYVHAKGLKLGIYSSPGPKTCGGYTGSYGHEEDDARTFAAWGIDYLKYDWCSAARIYAGNRDQLQRAYLKMGRALQQSGRGIVYSLCEYGSGAVWEWGADAGGNLWRTTNDIEDKWESVERIGFGSPDLAQYARLGRWNDPDMLEVGNGGMTTEEYRSHFSLWCLLAAPLMAGNDVRHMTPDTLAILGNREAIAIDQDPLGRQGGRVAVHGDIEIWTKPLQDGGVAIGLFNRGPAAAPATLRWSDLGRPAPRTLRDLWQHADLTPAPESFTATIPSHGVIFLRAQ